MWVFRSYGPRLIDVDVLFYGDAIVTTETANGPLIVPHERIAERDFVLAPFCDLAPGSVPYSIVPVQCVGIKRC